MRKLGSDKMTLLKNSKTTVLISILMLFIFAVTILIPNSTSRYQKSKIGNWQTPVALWSVSTSSNDDNINLIAGSTTTYTFTVNNDSDVSVTYSIEISNLPAGVQAKLDDGSYIPVSNNKIVISPAGELGFSGTTQKTHTLTFNTPLSTNEVSDQPVDIEVTFAQKID